MKLLLDTQVWLWMQSAPGNLGPRALDLVSDPENDLLLSAASSWEIAIKYALGKLGLPAPPSDYVPSRMQTSGTEGLAVTHAHALHVASLPDHHRDPFDRLLVAQAQVESLPVLTADPQIGRYDVEVVPASA
ncbi:MAG TPA: type II toxin-antitoxin system VapC family toxin [Planctomycetota bacterium]|nr:type II toxin-antitoxin system VapC family toxin [Planctomycetota bacterium]